MKRKTRATHDAWQQYKAWQKANPNKIREGQEIYTLGEFKEIYEQAGRRLNKVKNEVQYQTKYKTFRKIAKAYRAQYKAEHGNLKGFVALEAETARKKSTRELAELIKDDIKAFYAEEKRLNGNNAHDAKIAVSHYFFGS